MIRKTMTVAVALAAVSLSACNNHERMGANSAICPDFRTNGQAAPAQGADAAAPVDECVRRWAYSLASARDSADVVADAAVAACATALTHWNQAGLGQPPQDGGSDQPISLVTGEPTNTMAEHNAFARGRALLYAVQARAGQCAPPPVTNGVPAGV